MENQITKYNVLTHSCFLGILMSGFSGVLWAITILANSITAIVVALVWTLIMVYVIRIFYKETKNLFDNSEQ